jgi:hypothetical protein
MKLFRQTVFVVVALIFLSWSAFGSTITTGGSGNWSSTTPNAPWPGGTLPVAGDVVIIATGHTVVIDVPRIPATSGTLLSLTMQTTGTCTLNQTTAGVVEINATTITGGTTGHAINLSGGTNATTFNVGTGAGEGIKGGTSTACGLYSTATGLITVNGNITGGAIAASERGFDQEGAGTVAINGNVTGSVGPGYYQNAAATCTITGNATGGTGTSSFGANILNGTATLTGNGTTTGNIINGTGAVGWSGKPPTWSPAASNYHQIAAGKLALEKLATELKSGVVNGTITGTYQGAPFGMTP